MQNEMPIVTNMILGRIVKQKTPPVVVGGREFFSLTYRESGRITIKSERGDLVSGVGSITYIPRGLAYETEVLEEGAMYWLHVYTEGDMTLLGDKPLCCRPAAAEAFLENFSKAHARFLSSGKSFSCCSTVFRILAMAEEAFTPIVGAPPPQLLRVKREMDTRFADTTLKIGDFAAGWGVSEVYFRREFRRYFGTSPLDYIKQKRIENAARLLESGLCSVTDAALQSGFESLSYFSAEFRRMMGKSPSEYVRGLS